MCQYEETLSPYEDVAKAVYKSLVRAKKDGDGAAVASDVYSATSGVPAGGATKKTPCRSSRDRTTFRISVTCASTRGAGTSRCGTTRTCRTGRGTKEEKRARVRGRSKVFRKSSAGGRARRRTRLYIFMPPEASSSLCELCRLRLKKLGNTVSITTSVRDRSSPPTRIPTRAMTLADITSAAARRFARTASPATARRMPRAARERGGHVRAIRVPLRRGCRVEAVQRGEMLQRTLRRVVPLAPGRPAARRGRVRPRRRIARACTT